MDSNKHVQTFSREMTDRLKEISGEGFYGAIILRRDLKPSVVFADDVKVNIDELERNDLGHLVSLYLRTDLLNQIEGKDNHDSFNNRSPIYECSFWPHKPGG